MPTLVPLLQRCNRRLLAVLTAAVTLYLFGDFYSTYLSLRAGGVEVNPISRFIIQQLGIWWFFVAKLVEAVFIAGACIYLDVVVEWRVVSRWSPRLESVLSRFPVAVALIYTGIGLVLTFNNALVYMSMTPS